MRILLTNDDGVNAAGLGVLRDIAAKLSDDIWVVAPEANQSGSAHSLTIHEPLRCQQLDDRTWAVRGTPTDSVIMGVRHILLDNPPDLILSGVNRGSNIGEDVTYSGTIAGAIEGTLLGIRSFALSQSYGGGAQAELHWETARSLAPGLISRFMTVELPENTLININFPHCAPEEVAGTRITRQGKRDQNTLHIDERHDTWGAPYYWFGFGQRRSNPAEDTDLWAIFNNHVSVTPLHVDLTNPAAMEPLNAALERDL